MITHINKLDIINFVQDEANKSLHNMQASCHYGNGTPNQ